MFDIETHCCIGHSISHRASLVAELAAKIAEQDTRDAKARKKLLEKAPKSLRNWLENDAVLSTLFKYGAYSTKINFRDKYGFKNTDDAKKKLRALMKAWGKVITIRFAKPENDRVQVFLSAVII